MKKFAAVVSAWLLAALISVGAGAKDIAENQQACGSAGTADSAEVMRFSDASVGLNEGYTEDGSTYWSYDEYLLYAKWNDEPYVEIIDSSDCVELFCCISSDWEADYYVIQRKTSNNGSWSEVERGTVLDFSGCFDVWYTDYEPPAADYITYRFSFYKYFDEGVFEVTSAEVTVDGSGEPAAGGDLVPPTITVSNAASGDVQLFCSLELGWDVEDYIVERCTDYTDWEEIGTGSVRTTSTQYEVRFNDTRAPSGGTVYYRIGFYRYSLGSNGWNSIFVVSAEISLEIKQDYPAPRLLINEVSDTMIGFNLYADERWAAAKCVVNRRADEAGKWQKVGEMIKAEDWFDTLFTFTDSKLTQKTQYYYRFELYSAEGKLLTSAETSVVTAATPEKPKMLAPIAHSDRITLTVEVDSLWNADGFEVHRYSSKNKKWVMLYESEMFDYSDREDGYFLNATYTNTDLKSSYTYKYKVKLYREVNGKREYFSTLSKSVKTLMPAPKLTVGATSKTAKLSWSKVKGADGYEVYVLSPDDGNYSGWDNYWFGNAEGYTTLPKYDASLRYYNQSYKSSCSYSTWKISDFTKKSVVKDGKTSISYNIKSSKVYIYIVRAYKKSGSKKIYSDFSNQESTDTTSALLNGVTLKSKVTVSDSDMKLINAALKKCTNSKMTKAEKAAAIYDYVHNAATYEYDYSKIPADPVESILSAGRGQCYQYAAAYQAMMKYIGYDVKLVSGKNSSGNPHWWCQLTCAGKDFMIDPQVGGRFLITYDSMGYYAVTPEKVYD